MPITIPLSENEALHSTLERTLSEHDDLRNSLTSKFERLTRAVSDSEFNDTLLPIHAYDSNQSSSDSSDGEDDSDSDIDSIDEEDLLDVEAWERVEALRKEVQSVAKNVRMLRSDVPQRSVKLARKEMNQCLIDKEESLNIANKNGKSQEQRTGNITTDSEQLTNMQISLEKLAEILKCGEEEVLSGEKIIKLQRTIEAIEIGLEKKEPTALELAMMSDEGNECIINDPKDSCEELERIGKNYDPYSCFADYISRA